MTFGGWRNTCEPPGLHGRRQGDTGEQGPQGDTGVCECDTGLQGDTGVPGPQGDSGAHGDTGAQGQHGDTGIQGDSGVDGDQGDTGLQGDTGVGDTGIGDTGLQGDTGVAASGDYEDLDNVIMFIQSDHGLFYEDADWDVRLRTSAAVPGDNILLVQGWRSDTTNLEVWT